MQGAAIWYNLVMKRWIIATIAITALVITGLILYSVQAQKPVETATNAPTVNIPLNADTIFNLVNAEREKAGVKPLARDARLDATAQTRSDDMVARNYFSHNDPVDGRKMIDDQYYIDEWKMCKLGSENISQMEDPTGDNNIDTINGWMGSESHRNAILDQQYDIAGLAVTGNKVVQHFCNLK